MNFQSCSKRVPIENFDSEKWKNDHSGCNGDRLAMVQLLNESQVKFVGMKRTVIISILGNPEFTELYPKGQLLYKYHITPAKNCNMYLPEQQHLMLELRINALGIVSEALINRAGSMAY